VAPRGDATRPTSDRVREALFSILEAKAPVRGLRVLDLYAGTGALGLEALSRGAARCVFVEKGRDALAALKKNIDALGVAPRCSVLSGTVEKATRTLDPAEPFELIFCDPPYADVRSGTATRALAAIVARVGHLHGGIRVVLEHASEDSPPALPNLGPGSTRRYGDTSLTFYAQIPA